MEEQEFEMGENQKALGGCGMVIAFLIIAGVTIYSDVMFIWVMWNYFPQGFLGVGAILGALMTGASILTLLIGKSYWFRPGMQTVGAWCFTGVEIFVSVLNILLATNVAKGDAGILSYWGYISPATPIFASIGWIILWQLDRATVIRHKHMAMQDKIANSNMAYTLKVHQAQMSVKTQHLKQVSEQLNNVLNSERVQAQIAQHAERMVAKVLTDVTGMNAFLPSRTVDGSGTALPLPEPVQVAAPVQSASAPTKKGIIAQAVGFAKGFITPDPGPNVAPVQLAQTAPMPASSPVEVPALPAPAKTEPTAQRERTARPVPSGKRGSAQDRKRAREERLRSSGKQQQADPS